MLSKSAQASSNLSLTSKFFFTNHGMIPIGQSSILSDVCPNRLKQNYNDLLNLHIPGQLRHQHSVFC